MTSACADMAPELEKLRAKSVQKIRDFLLQRVASLRKKMTNIQILQQSVLLKYKGLYKFLEEHAPEVAAEVREAAAATRLDAALRGSAQLKCLLAASLEEQRATLDASLSHPSGQRLYTAAGDPDSVGSQPSLEQRAVVDSSSPSESSPAAFHTPREF